MKKAARITSKGQITVPHEIRQALGARRILADFLIGAHALHNGFSLLTLDDRLYRAAFRRLAILAV